MGDSSQPQDEHTNIEDCLNVTVSSFATICIINNTIGFALYDEQLNAVFADSIAIGDDDVSATLASLKSSCTVSLWLVHPKIVTNTDLLDLITTGLDGTPNYYRYQVLKSSFWNADAAVETISTKLIVDNKRVNYLWISTIVDMDSVQQRQALGALILYMQQNAFHLDNGLVTISAIRRLAVKSFMRIDEVSLRALQIFAQEFHPNVMSGSGRGKEGFSLFGLFDRTKSLPGRQLLRDWMKKPFYDINRIIHRQDGVQFAVRSENGDIINEICKNLRKVHSIPQMLLRIRKAEASYKEWCHLCISLQHSLYVIEYLIMFASQDRNIADVQWVRSMLEGLDIDLSRNVYQELHNCIDVEQSMADKTLTFHAGFDGELDNLRDIFDQLPSLLTEAAQEILVLQPLLDSVSVEYVSQIGYLIAVDSAQAQLLTTGPSETDMWLSDGEARPTQSAFDFIYEQNGHCYYKHEMMYKLDDSIGDIKNMILDRQRDLLIDIEEQLLTQETQLQLVANAVATIDAIISLGEVAIQMKFSRPTIVEDSVVIVKNGRHPLQELTVHAFVPNDAYLTDTKFMGLITGPNSSGKSVYLKQIGIMVYLAHIGSWLPCDEAVIGLTDRIFTRITTIESVSSQLSSFASDLNQMGSMLSGHSSRSLCLIDEFGKGTSPVDGISLLAATIMHFMTTKPKVLIVLHFTEVLKPELLQPSIQESMEFYFMETYHPHSERMIADGSDPDEDEDIMLQTPLFKLRRGISKSSEGIPCAKSAGIPDRITTRATHIVSQIAGRTRIRPLPLKNRLLSDKTKGKLLVAFLEQSPLAGGNQDEYIAFYNQFKLILA